MKKKFQLVLSISVFAILLAGIIIFAQLASKILYKEIAHQIVKDNRVTGEEILKLIERNDVPNKSLDSIAQFLQNICDEVKLPNNGFVCAVKPGGELIAGPGLKPGHGMSLSSLQLTSLDSDTTMALRNIRATQVFQGFAKHMNNKVDIIVSRPIPNTPYRLLVHQNNEKILERISKYVNPLYYLGGLISLVFGIVAYFFVDYVVKSYESKLEVKNAQLENALEELKTQRDTISHQKEDITNSIIYAQRIQQAILPEKEFAMHILKEHFILFKPRDIVSGDFYWVTEKEGKKVFAVADCTGHGVPGAFMSMLGVAFLNEIVNEKGILQADLILNNLREKVMLSLKQTGKRDETKDGMDIALCVLDTQTNELQFAGANNPLYLIRNNELNTIKPDKMPIGIYRNADKPFTNNSMDVLPGDVLYLFSDGYPDQFGGPKKSKFKYKPFRDLFLSIHKKKPTEQEKALSQALTQWQGDLEQVDDICVMGVVI